jgi:hypothetical protein
MKSKGTLVNNSEAWSAVKRYKVNQLVSHNGSDWQNSTGETGVGSDWIKSIPSQNLQSTTTGAGNNITTEFLVSNSGFKLISLFEGLIFHLYNDGGTSLLDLINGEISNARIISSRDFNVKNIISGFSTAIKNTTGTAFRTATLPDKNGTFAFLDDINQATGWEQITDSTYTLGSPLSIASGVTGKILTGTVTKINSQIPLGVTTFYNATTDKLLGVNEGDSFTISIRFKAKMNVLTGLADVAINIGGAFNKINQETLVFSKGAGIEHRFDVDFTYFTGSTFIANGGDIEIIPFNGDIEIYDIVLLPNRTHKGYS